MPQTESQEGYMDKGMISFAFNTYFYIQINLYTLETLRIALYILLENFLHENILR